MGSTSLQSDNEICMVLEDISVFFYFGRLYTLLFITLKFMPKISFLDTQEMDSFWWGLLLLSKQRVGVGLELTISYINNDDSKEHLTFIMIIVRNILH